MNLVKRYSKATIITVLIASSLIVALGTAIWGPIIAILAIVLVVITPLAFSSLKNIRFGYYLLLVYSFFLFQIARIVARSDFKPGIGYELIIMLLVVGLVLNLMVTKSKLKFNFVQVVIILITVYGILQVINPNAHSISGWINYLRLIIFNLLLYFVSIHILDSKKAIYYFTRFWLVLCLIGAIYGIYQELFGYNSFEWNFVLANPGILELIQLGPLLRKFSFFADVATFGLLMSFSGIFCMVIALSKFNFKLRVFCLISAILMIVSMSFSGTRTAVAMIPVGFIFYGLLTINKGSTIIFSIVISIIITAIIVGPFYGTTATRIKTAFSPSSDASMTVRDVNRKMIQPYILSHPIGGGPNTTGGVGKELSPGHYLAGFPPDSGYLKTALELGWIGLILEVLLYVGVLHIGINAYFKLAEGSFKYIIAAYLASFFALCVANITQESMMQKPTIVIVSGLFVILPFSKKYIEDEK